MKKILALILASMMLLTLVACGNTEETTTEAPVNNEETTVGGNEETTVGGNEETTVGGAEENAEGVIAPNVSESSWGYAFWNVFAESVKNNSEIATGEIVYNILTSDAGMPLGFCENMDMVEGYLPGFSADITGFESATVFTPAASGFAFMGYVFKLSEGADVEAFINTLNENCDLRWMICMTAESVTVGAYNNYVFFVMCPENIPNMGGADAEILYPETAEDGTYAAEIWNFFEQAMSESAGAGAEEMAYAVAYSPVVPFNLSVVTPVDMAVENAHFANGFDCIEEMYSITEEGSDLVIYVFSIELGLDPAGWGAWYVTGENVVWGAYNNTLIAIHNGNIQ